MSAEGLYIKPLTFSFQKDILLEKCAGIHFRFVYHTSRAPRLVRSMKCLNTE